jgi:hypothetical protein
MGGDPGTARCRGRTRRPAGHPPDGRLVAARRSPPADPLVTGISGDSAAASPPAAPAIRCARGLSRRLPARPARHEKVHPASAAPETPISADVTAPAASRGMLSQAAHISG